MIRALHTPRSPIGLDLGARCLKAVQLGGSAGNRQIEAVAAIPRKQIGKELDAQELQRFCSILRRRGFSGRKVVAGQPHHMLMSELLELPVRSSGAPIDQIARMELSRACKKEPDSFEMCCYDLPAPARAQNASFVFATACAHDDANALLDLLESQGLDVCALDVQPWAALRACVPLLAGSNGISAVLDMGWTAARFILLHQKAIIYTRTFQDASLASLEKQIADTFGVDHQMADHLIRQVGLDTDVARKDGSQRAVDICDAVANYVKAITDELDRSFFYGSHRYPDVELDRLLLVGGGSVIPKLAEHLHKSLESLNVQVQLASPANMIKCHDSVVESCGLPQLTTALGLAQNLD